MRKAGHTPSDAASHASEHASQDKFAERAELEKRAAEAFQREEERRGALPRIRTEGVDALQRLLKVALGHSGQCKIVAAFLLSCYNGNRFKFDLTDFRCLDHALFEDCLAVLRMDYQPAQEVHTYFKDGGQIWEQMAKDWNIRDYMKPAKADRS